MPDTGPRRLTRSHDRMLGGVAGGLADYFDFDPTVMRLLVVLAALLSGGVVIIAYIVMWIVIPEAPTTPTSGSGGTGDGAANAAGVTEVHHDDRTQVVGIVLIAIGALVLLNQVAFFNTFGWRVMRFWWPALLILGGLALLAARRD
jgi:phage shock protein C